eukprot:9587302-Ditylum_brightwellii.AAC.1
MDLNLLASAICRANRNGFLSDDLEFSKNVRHGEYVCKVHPCLCTVVTRWKDSRVLQTISTVMVKRTITVQQWTGQEVQSTQCPNDAHNCHDSMGAVDKGDQHRALGA